MLKQAVVIIITIVITSILSIFTIDIIAQESSIMPDNSIISNTTAADIFVNQTNNLNTDSPLKEVIGKYSNSDSGLEIVFPEGWKGLEVTGGGGNISSMVVVAPAALSIKQEGKPEISMSLTIANTTIPSLPPEICQKLSSRFITLIGNINALEEGYECVIIDKDDNELLYKTKTLSLPTGNKYVFIDYTAVPPTNYEKYITDFDESIRTLKVTSAGANNVSSTSLMLNNTTESQPILSVIEQEQFLQLLEREQTQPLTEDQQLLLPPSDQNNMTITSQEQQPLEQLPPSAENQSSLTPITPEQKIANETTTMPSPSLAPLPPDEQHQELLPPSPP
jgi:hypothetical protein